MKKTTQFKRLLQSDQVEFLMEAHNGLSAKIVEDAFQPGDTIVAAATEDNRLRFEAHPHLPTSVPH